MCEFAPWTEPTKFSPFSSYAVLVTQIYLSRENAAIVEDRTGLLDRGVTMASAAKLDPLSPPAPQAKTTPANAPPAPSKGANKPDPTKIDPTKDVVMGDPDDGKAFTKLHMIQVHIPFFRDLTLNPIVITDHGVRLITVTRSFWNIVRMITIR